MNVIRSDLKGVVRYVIVKSLLLVVIETERYVLLDPIVYQLTVQVKRIALQGSLLSLSTRDIKGAHPVGKIQYSN